MSGSAAAATVPRRTRLVPRCVHRSTNAARAAYPNPAGLVEVLHIVFIPSAAQGLLLPFAASVAFPLKRGCPQGGGLGVFTSANDAPSASLRVSSPSRPDNYLSLHRVSAPRLRRHTTPLQSVVRSPSRTSNTIAERPHENKGLLCRSRSRRLSPTKRLLRSPSRPIPAAPPRREAPSSLSLSKGQRITRSLAR